MLHSTTSVTASAAESPLILALDVGSSSVRAIVYDGQGRVVAGFGAQEHYALHTTTEGGVEDDAAAALARVARCIDALLAQVGTLAHRIAAVAVDTLASTFLALDGAGQPLTALITYADTRNATDAQALRQRLNEGQIHDRTGCLLRTSYWPARLAWLQRTQPAVWNAAAHWATLGEYLERGFFGLSRVSFSVAAWTGMLDRRRLEWDTPLLEALGLSIEQFAPLVDVNEPLVGLAEPYASRWPALRSVPWFPAIGDGAAANIGSGCTNHSRVALTVGTTGAMRVVQPSPASVPLGLWCYRVNRELALVGGATSEGGNVYAWLRQMLQLGDAASIEAALAAEKPDGHGLTMLPFVAGERSPGWAGNVPASIHGLTLATTPIALVRASLEAVAYRFAVIQQRLCDQPSCEHRLIASGGALLSSPTWMQIFADVLGKIVVASAETETTSRGAALLALRSLAALPSLEAAPAADGSVYEPDPARHTLYQEAIVRQAWLYKQVIPNG